jgi:DNA-binding IclR family transcriptional regulator
MRNSISTGRTVKTVPRPADKIEDPYFSRSVSKAFEVLAVLSNSRSTLSVNEVAERTELTKSFAFRLLRTLESLQHVVRSADGRFMITQGNYLDASQLATRLSIAAREPMRKLNRSFQETVSLAALFGNRIEVIEVFDSPHLMRMTNIVGRILPPHASSLGKAITAFQPESDQRQLIRNYGLLQITNNTITDENLLVTEFEQIRKQGYARDVEESILGAHCLGAPIYLEPARVIGAVSLSMPKSRLPDSKAERDQIVQSVKAVAQKISETLNSS